MVSATKYMTPYSGVPNQITQAGLPAPVGTPMTTTAVQTGAMPVAPLGAGAPQTGLIGAEQAINQGANQARADVTGALSQIGAPNAYTLGGGNAAKLQADLSGANGPEAAAAAQQTLATSPATQYMLDTSQRGIERTAAARGNLLGGNVLQELQQNAIGLASQDYQNQFNNLGAVADRGANMQSLQDQAKASLSRDLASTAMTAGINTAGLRFDAGQAIANNASQAASQISNLLNQQGIAVSDMVAKDISTISDIIYQSGLGQSMNTANLAAILANIAGGQASTVAQGNAQIGAANAAGTIGVNNAIQQGIQQGIQAGVIGR